MLNLTCCIFKNYFQYFYRLTFPFAIQNLTKMFSRYWFYKKFHTPKKFLYIVNQLIY